MKRFLGLLLVLMLLSLMILTGQRNYLAASALQKRETITKPERSGYIRRANNDTVIVFVHGIFGGPTSTWINAATGSYWPELLTQDNVFSNSDIYAFGYDTPYLSTSYSLDDLIENARLRLNNDEVFSKHKRVIFVCHSMGGLVVRGLIKRYQDKAPQITLIYFLSTPTAGAHIAKLASFFSHNPQLGALMPANADNFVTTLQHDWRALPVHPLSKCAFELKETNGVKVVDEQSASALCDGSLDPINEDHLGIAKPRDKDADAYIAFRQAFLSAQSQARPVTPPRPVVESIVGHVDTLRRVQVECGEVKEDIAEISPPVDLQEGRKLVGAVASLQAASNLKHGEALSQGVKNEKASIYYRLEGLDRGTDGLCAGAGSGIILVAFLLRQPRSSPLPPGFQAVSASDRSLEILGRSGGVWISEWGHIPQMHFGGEEAGCWPHATSANWVLVAHHYKETGYVATMYPVKTKSPYCPEPRVFPERKR